MLPVLEKMLQRQLFADSAIPRTAKLIYLGMRAHRKTTIKGYSETLQMPESTIRRAMGVLKERDWVYSFRDEATGERIYVPWMPVDVEHTLAAAVGRLVEVVPNRGEWTMKRILDIIVNDESYVDNARVRWAAPGSGANPLEFDCLFEDSKVAVEHHGRQHFESVSFPNGKSDFPRQHARDGIKALACQRRGYTLVEIADVELSPETIIKRLRGLVPLLPFRIERPLGRKLSDICDSYSNWAKDQRGKK